MKNRVDFIKIILAMVVALMALLVRMPTAFLIAVSEEVEEFYKDDSGLPYFTDPDSYYHVRLVDTMLRTGKIADTISDEGEPWDTHSFFPEGRSAVYQPGIVYLTITLWKLFNLSVPIDISRVEFYISGFMAMFTALAAYIAGYRINGKICGLIAGILVGCSPEFVSRTSFGRFDTDIFVVLMNVLLILLLTEMLRSDSFKKQLELAIAFVLTAVIYGNCWAPQFSTLFVGLTIVGGLVYAILNNLQNDIDSHEKKRFITTIANRQFFLLIGTGLTVLLVIGLSKGFSTVVDVFKALSFTTTQAVSESALPNVFDSISELQRPEIVPDHFRDWFRGYILGSQQTIVTGIGGAFATASAIGGLVLLCLRSFKKINVKMNELPQEQECRMYLSVLGLWTVAGLYLARSGIRFIEILTAPTGILAGIFTGWLINRLWTDNIKRKIGGVVISFIVMCLIVLPDLEGVFLCIRLPSVTDASAYAMKWIRENADTPDAVIESWWDMGYFYESESGHPCLWDGGTQDPIRTILFSRAMIEKDMGTSCRILNMLACSGNEGVELLMEHTDPKTAFETLWEVIPIDSRNACDIISQKCGMSIQEACEAEKLIHPVERKEAYLVLTYRMIDQTVMYEYYSNWDFTGMQTSPYKTGTTELQTQMTEAELEELEEKRCGYTMWRLFYDVEDNPFFTQEYDCNDGLEGLRVWRICPSD